jgi:DDE domain
VMLGGDLAVVQASVLDGVSFDPFSFQEDGLATSEVDVGTWDVVYLKIDGHMVYLWRAVDAEGEILDVLVQSKRDKHAAAKLVRKLLKKYCFVPDRLIH